jgi:predicted short-subunit dehydrogenase-like oxidoreductase (DUF2520 family)
LGRLLCYLGTAREPSTDTRPDRLPLGGVAGGTGPKRTGRPRERPSHVWYLWQNWNRQVSIEASATSLRFAVVGAGRLGSSLALALREHGLALVGFTAGSDAGRARAEGWLGVPALSSVAELVKRRPHLYFVCVPDGAVAEAAISLAAELREVIYAMPESSLEAGAQSSPVVAHTSGATSVSALLPCEEAGAATLVFHPLQTFPEPLTGATRFAGAGVALTPGPGDPDTAGTTGMKLADLLGMRPFFLADDKRGLYHAAATVACNYLVTLEYLAGELFVKAGVPERVALSLFLPLVETTLENLATRGPVAALTGPLSRGDAATITAHLETLALEAPEALPVYRALGLATLDLVAARHEVDAQVLARLHQLLTGPASQPTSAATSVPAKHGSETTARTNANREEPE